MVDFVDFIQEVKRANDIVDVISSYLEVRQRGTNFFARCPFHGEKTASFSISRQGQFYHCFGCGESGDVVKFVQMHESCSLYEAVEILAKRAGLKMPETAVQKQDKQFAEKKKKRDLYLEILKAAAVFYYKAYNSAVGEKARSYMEGRGFDQETVKTFAIGYSPDMFSLVNFLEKKGYSHADCLACGVLQSKSNGTVFDALSGRLIVPIFDKSGKVIAFGGRGLDEKTISFGKYKNTSDTPIFNKKDNLYALNLAKKEKQQAQLPNLVVVEGYMDVIAMYQAGFRRSVASMGTSLTENQAKLLSSLTDTVYICYDGDAAGQKATVRGLDILDKAGLEVKVMSVPDNLDPDEYIKAHGAEAFEKLIERALSLPDYKIQLLLKAFPIDSKDAATRNNALPKFVNGAVKMLKQLDSSRQQRYMTEISKMTGYSEDFLKRKVEEKDTQAVDEPAPQETLSAETKAKYFVLASLLTNQEFASLSEKPYCETAFLSDMFDYVLRCRREGKSTSLDMMYTVCPNASESEYQAVLDCDFSPSRKEKNRQYFEDCKRLIVVEGLKTERDKLIRELKEHPEKTELIAQIAELNRKITK